MKALLQVSLVLLGLGIFSAYASSKQTGGRHAIPQSGLTPSVQVLQLLAPIVETDGFMVIGAEIRSAAPMSFTPVKSPERTAGQ